MKKITILEEGDFVISIPSVRKTVIVQGKEIYIYDGNTYPAETDFTKYANPEKE